ncbi:hypothetical protein MPSEU_000172600 [Mayamaea pseudoterrestris]|nr:hypothetical protein MPSEU_000172600 [Mayamaea pseudoterrestris]
MLYWPFDIDLYFTTNLAETNIKIMLRPNRRPEHGGNDDLNGSSSSLDLGYGNAGAAAPYGTSSYGGGHPASTFPAVAASYGAGRKPVAADGYSIYKDKPARRSGGGAALDTFLSIAKQPIAWISLLMAVLLWSTVSHRSQVNNLLKQFNVKSIKQAKDAYSKLQDRKVQLERDVARVRSQEQSNTKKFVDLDRSFKTLQREKEDLNKKLKAAEQKVATALQAPQQGIATLASSKELAYKELVKSLQTAVQRESRRAVLDKFGAPPYRVGLTVKLPSNLQESRTFTVEMAPLEDMPHAVHLFLEQVAHGLWNGNAYFYVNGPHVIQCGPQASYKEGDTMLSPAEERQKALAPFKELQLDALAFPEYSDQFTHLPWTLGFTGRPGGPDWYLNKRNNTQEHGPGGIGGSNHELNSEYGDPCFAKVVDGFDVVKSMFAEKTIESEDTQFFFEEPIEVVKAEIIGWNQQFTAEAAAIAANVTIQHATGAEDVQLKVTTGGAVNEAASKIAAKLAAVSELSKKLEGLNSGPWDVKNESQNREMQDSELEEIGPSAAEDKAPQPKKYVATAASTDADKSSEADASKTQMEVPDDGLPRPGGGDGAVVSTSTNASPPEQVYGDGNIDPRYAQNVKDSEKADASFIDAVPAGSAGSAKSSGAERKKKKELMMARS